VSGLLGEMVEKSFWPDHGSGDFVWRCRAAEIGAGKSKKRHAKMTKLIKMGCRQEI
jgi:hypothetical protein